MRKGRCLSPRRVALCLAAIERRRARQGGLTAEQWALRDQLDRRRVVRLERQTYA